MEQTTDTRGIVDTDILIDGQRRRDDAIVEDILGHVHLPGAPVLSHPEALVQAGVQRRAGALGDSGEGMLGREARKVL